MTRRAVFVLAAVCAGVLMTSTPAFAGGTPPANDDDYTALCTPIVLTNAAPQPGDTLTVSGTAASANATIVIVLNDQNVLGVTTSAADRTFSKEVTIPADFPPGDAHIQAFQIGDETDPLVGCPAQVLDLVITAPSGEPLARTGSPNSTLPLTRLGFGLVAAGGLVVLVTRRRKALAEA